MFLDEAHSIGSWLSQSPFSQHGLSLSSLPFSSCAERRFLSLQAHMSTDVRRVAAGTFHPFTKSFQSQISA